MNLDKLMGKHLTRYFDPTKTIPEETLQQLLNFLSILILITDRDGSTAGTSEQAQVTL